jgi:hypothetical protein
MTGGFIRDVLECLESMLTHGKAAWTESEVCGALCMGVAMMAKDEAHAIELVRVACQLRTEINRNAG